MNEHEPCPGILIQHMDYRAFLRALPDGNADLILTDPPYGIQYQNGFTHDPHALLAGDTGIDYPALARECYRVLRDNAHAYFFTRFDKYPEHYRHLEAAGFQIKNCLVLEKGTIGGIGDLAGSFSNNAEWAIFCQKGRCSFQKTTLLKNRKKVGVPPGPGRSPIAEYKTRFPCCWFGLEYPKATYNSAWLRTHAVRHPTVKNAACLEWLIRLSSVAGELVVDPFVGSGSTALAALRAGRRFAGCDIDGGYVKMARERVIGGDDD